MHMKTKYETFLQRNIFSNMYIYTMHIHMLICLKPFLKNTENADNTKEDFLRLQNR